jgi:acetoacetyl-CoA synthetase
MYAYVKNNIKFLFINNGSGGTDVCAGLVGSCPTLPIYPGVVQVPFLGCAIAAFDDDGNNVDVGEGELVITRPMPMMPLGFLGDSDRSRLRDTYFNHYPGKTIWYHADHSKRLAAISDWITH